MNNHTDKESLLAEVLAEASPADFRAAMLMETLRLARRRRQFRQMRSAAGVLVVMGLLVILIPKSLYKEQESSQPLVKRIAKPGYELVRTRAMPVSELISTRNYPEVHSVASVSTVVEIATASGGFLQINDNELLAFLADEPAVLIRTGPHSEELVFANPEDQKKFLFY
jgi:multidrug efflux pump subunit AcrB